MIRLRFVAAACVLAFYVSLSAVAANPGRMASSLAGVEVSVVQDAPGYNSWPMVQAVGDRLVCAYSRGSAHTIDEGRRGVYAKTSLDGGATWSDEVCVVNDPALGEVTIGKGLDESGSMLLWVRNWGQTRRHDLYRTRDGVSFERIASPALDPMPMQITDTFKVDGVGLVSLWFAGSYRDGNDHSWGMLASSDNGLTWTQHTVERGLSKAEWPTEQSAVCLGDGRILAIARSEGDTKVQYQLTSTDGGRTWRKERTNICDVFESTPSLLYDAESKTVFNYYYQRGARLLKCRTAKVDEIFGRPMSWQGAVPIAQGGEQRHFDAGNVNATLLDGRHVLALYSGTKSDTTVFAVSVPCSPCGLAGGLSAPEVARRAAEESIVLLKNESGTLPLAKDGRVALYGSDRLLECGGGSAKVNAVGVVGLAEGFAAEGVEVADPESGADLGVVLVSRISSEARDNDDADFALRPEELKAVADARARCGRVAVVVNSGYVMDLSPLKDDPGVGAILFVWFPGQQGGAAIARIVCGKVNPSGRLAVTMAARLDDWPSHRTFRAEARHVSYAEGMDVGYRYFNKKAKDRIVYPFGHGLSYSEWKVESCEGSGSEGALHVATVRVTNTGKAPGRHSVLKFDAEGELESYAKTRLLAPGESQTLSLKPFDPSQRDTAAATPGYAEADAKARAVVAGLTLEEKAELCSAQPPAMPRGTAGIGNLPALGVPNAQTADGPNGIRTSAPATCFPACALLAQSFDDELACEMGRAIGWEAVERNVDILLGPGLNIHRHPLCGRNFEYFSEDPLLSGKMAAAYVRGVQSTGVAATLKHFCCNNREWMRHDYSSEVDEVTLRRIYLRGFEIAVKEGHPRCVMTAYNMVNGTFAGECGWLVDGILRGEWGFAGMVMTDWRAKSEIYAQIAAGCDANMPYGYPEKVARAVEKARSGELPAAAIDACAVRTVREALLSNRAKKGDFGPICRISAGAETTVSARGSRCVSSTWTLSVDDPVEGWGHAGLGKDPRGSDVFVEYMLDVEEAGEYDVFIRACSELKTSSCAYEYGGAVSARSAIPQGDEWRDLGPVRISLRKGRSPFRVWFFVDEELPAYSDKGAKFTRLVFKPAVG